MLNYTDLFNAISGSEFDEIPVSIEEFVTGEQYLNLPETPLSENQYRLIKASSQIYRRETLHAIYGYEEGEKRWGQTYNEVIFQLGKGCHVGSDEVYDADSGRWTRIDSIGTSDGNVATVDQNGAVSSGYRTESFTKDYTLAYEVTTSKGFVVTVSADHKFITPGFSQVPLRDLSVGSRIAIAASLPVNNEVAIDEREVKLLGYWLGDGMMPLDQPRRRCINMDFSENDVNAMNEYIEIHRSYGDNPTVRKHPTKKMWYVRSMMGNSPAILEIAKKHGLVGKRAHDKSIPDAIWSLPKDQLSIFISRLWGTDGCVYLKKCGTRTQPTLEYTTISKELATGIQRILARLGIIAGLRSRIPTYTYNGEVRHGQRAYYLTISDGPGFLRFHNAIKMMDKDTGPGAELILSRQSSYPSRYENDIYWDKIKSIKEVGTEELFTVTATDHSNFVANMVLNGNSGK